MKSELRGSSIFQSLNKSFANSQPFVIRTTNPLFTSMKITEAESKYHHLEKMTVHDLLANINREDKTVPGAVQKVLPQIEKLVKQIVPRMKKGGRLFYLGAGTSGR